MTVSNEVRKQIAEQSYGLVGDIGGIKRQTYYTPDGRVIKAIPSIREWKRKVNDSLETGLRDANLDKGWLLQPPQNPVLQCPHCDKWHDTQEEVDKCGVQRQVFDNRWLNKAKKDTDKSEVEELREEMDEIKGLLKKLLEKESA